MISLLQISALLALELSASSHTTWHVDGTACDGSGTGTGGDPFCTIQEAIDAASSGDKIRVRPGVYQENLVVPAIELEIRGDHGGEGVILLGAPPGERPLRPAIAISAGAFLELDKLIIRRGKPGIICRSATVVAKKCQFEENEGTDDFSGSWTGGAAWGHESSFSFESCNFARNRAEIGGAVFAWGGSVELRDSDLVDNCAALGGAIFVANCSLDVLSCTFTAASCKCIMGGAIYSDRSEVMLDGCSVSEHYSGVANGVAMFAEDSNLDVQSTTFEDNRSSQGWGVINLDECTAAFSDCRFEGNQSGSGQLEGGAFYIHGAVSDHTSFKDCQFIDNWSAEGGAVLAHGVSVDFEACFFGGNRAFCTDRYGHGNGGAIASWAATVNCDRCVLIDNQALGRPYEGTGKGGAVMGPANLNCCTLVANVADSAWGQGPGEGAGAFNCTLNSCVVWQNTPDSLAGTSIADWSDVGGGWPGTGNFDRDPLFWGPEHRDFRILPASPCIDTGDPTQMDTDGSRLDVGAFAFDPAYCGTPGTYCEAKENSEGCLPSIGWSGTPTIAGSDKFHILASNVLHHEIGVLVWSTIGAASKPFLGGKLCLAPPHHRSPVLTAGHGDGTCDGEFNFHFRQALMAANGLGAGNRLYFQFWYRDPGHPDGTCTGLTDGLEATICVGTGHH